MHSQLDLMIEGVPSHSWTRDTVAELLGSGCLVDSLAPETASREDLSLFKLRAWCVDPDEVPVAKRLWVPEPEVVGSPAARWPSSRQLLEYKTLIHIGRVKEHVGPEGWLRPLSSDGSGQSGLPEDSDNFSGNGEWRVLPWTGGVSDARGGAPAGGAPGGSYRQALLGRVGPPDWRIPPMPMGVASVQPRQQPMCPASPVSREPFPAPTAVVSPNRTVGTPAASDPGQGPVASAEIAPMVGLATEDPSGGATGQELVVAGAVGALSPALEHELPPAAGNKDKSADSVLEESVHPEDGARVCNRATEGTGLDGTGILEVTGQVLAPEIAQCHVPRDVGLVEDSIQEGEPAPGWALVVEISSGAPLHAVVVPVQSDRAGADPEPEAGGEPVGCMDVIYLVEHAGCMDGDTPMHVHADLLLSPKDEVAVANIKDFCTGLLKKLGLPLLKEIEAVRGNCVAQDTARRNTRASSACAPRKTGATTTETVLLKALGITPDGLAVTDEVLGQLRQMFDSPIQEPQLRTMAAIFGKAVPFDLGMEEASRVALLA
ncbi:hypothetical protein CFC21_058960 [Triticum aestivum]|uniref:DUF4283 domain-containing protein n=2 Tax=Triticum aestivum TaxID=4565 RepID=A0A3B6IXZ7_WHEAT|nr:hypothetical protein CFC21_058960 [Triticum aestivum]